jgi:hypothetical protein
MIAIWKDFVQESFRKTRFRTTFNGKTRSVYRDGGRLLVLDEYHGDLEVLAMQVRPGDATHIGSQEIDAAVGVRSGAKSSEVEVKLGKYTPGGKHKFTLIGSLG